MTGVSTATNPSMMLFGGLDVQKSREIPPTAGEVHDLMLNQKELADEADYDQAEAAAEQAVELLDMEHKRQKDALWDKHQMQINEMMETCEKELAEFALEWDKKDEVFEAKALETTMEHNNRARDKYRAHMNEVRKNTKPIAPHYSGECNRLMKLHKALGKQRRFGEASKIKLEFDKMRKNEEKEWNDTREAKIKALEDTYLAFQDREFNAYMMRLHNARDEHEKTRKTEFSRLQQRHRNMKAQLEHEQVIAENNEEAKQFRERLRTDVPTTGLGSALQANARRPILEDVELNREQPSSSGLALLSKIMSLRTARETSGPYDVYPSELQLPSASEKVYGQPFEQRPPCREELPAASSFEPVHMSGPASRYRG